METTLGRRRILSERCPAGATAVNTSDQEFLTEKNGGKFTGDTLDSGSDNLAPSIDC